MPTVNIDIITALTQRIIFKSQNTRGMKENKQRFGAEHEG